jgi:hypothetical protein
MHFGQRQNEHGLLPRLAIVCVVALSPRIAIADDPCQEPSKQVVALVGALNKAVSSTPKPGQFALKRSSEEHEAGKFQVFYLIDGRPVFARRLEQQSTVSEHFTVSALPSILELRYSFGAGGSIFCNYQIARTAQTFVARIRANGEQRYRPLMK